MANERPLSGLSVLDLTGFIAGPYCTQLLGALGADVIKIEPVGRGDSFQEQGPEFIQGEGALFLAFNANKRSLALNFRSEAGQEIMRRLIRRSDILVQNFRPGALAKVGLDYAAAHRLNPRLVYASISGYGQTGPASQRGGFDPVEQATGGLMSVTGESSGPPVKAGAPVLDIGAGMLAAVGALTALWHRERTGEGQHVDTSLLDFSVASLTSIAASYFVTGRVPGRHGTASPSFSPYQTFRVADGELFIAGAGSEDLWQRFARAVGLAALIADPRFATNSDRAREQHTLAAIIEERLVTQPMAHWQRVLDEANVPCGPVNDLAAAFADPQIEARRLIEEIEHPTAGRIRTTGIPIKFSAVPLGHRLPPPRLGEHTAAILGEVGYGDEEIGALKASGVVQTAPAAPPEGHP